MAGAAAFPAAGRSLTLRILRQIGRCPATFTLVNAPRLDNRVHCFVALDARKVTEPELDDGEVIVAHEVPFATFLEELRDGRRTFHGFQGGALWLLHAFARRTRDKRLAALLD